MRETIRSGHLFLSIKIRLFKDTFFVVKTTPLAGSAPAQKWQCIDARLPAISYQWYLNAAAISGSTNQTISINQNGNYSYKYSINGCTSPKALPLVQYLLQLSIR
jgi:hypothetical protein